MSKVLKHLASKGISSSKATSQGISGQHVVAAKKFSTSRSRPKKFNEPLHGSDMARAGGIASMMRLPIQETTEGLDACFVGIPIDHGTSNRSGTRMGPRQIRTESVLLRQYNIQTGADPFSSIQVADVGDVRVNPYDLPQTCEKIREQYDDLVKNGCRPLTLGGDHTLSYPVLQAIGKKHGPVALVHIDAHSDTAEGIMGTDINHATPFRRAVEENLLVCDKVFQIGLRGPTGILEEFDFATEKGFNLIHAKECWHKSMNPLMEKIRKTIGDTPTYISFDIDGLDPSFAPGTGTPEVGGLTIMQGLEIVRGCRGLNVVGGDLVEVSPPYDICGTTALMGANLLFEMLCILPGVKYHKKAFGMDA